MSHTAQPFSFAKSGVPLSMEIISNIRVHIPPLQNANVCDVLGGACPQLTDYFAHYGFVELSASVPHAQYRIGRLSVEECEEAVMSDVEAKGSPAEAATAKELVVHHWHLAEGQATVCVFHGLFDHVGLYLPVIEHLLLLGVNVVAVDMIGHGLSCGERAAISNFKHYAPLVGGVIGYAKEYYPQLDLIAMGQSTGAAAVMNYQLGLGEKSELSKAIYLAPLIRPYKWTLIQLALKVLGRVLTVFPRGFSVNSHNAEFCDFLQHHDPLQPRHLSIPWLHAMAGWVSEVERRLALRQPEKALEHTPLMIIQGTGDKTVDWQTNIQFLQELTPKAHIVLVDQAKHHLVNESQTYRHGVFEALSRFIR